MCFFVSSNFFKQYYSQMMYENALVNQLQAQPCVTLVQLCCVHGFWLSMRSKAKSEVDGVKVVMLMILHIEELG